MTAQATRERSGLFVVPSEPDSYTFITHNGAVRHVGPSSAKFAVLVPDFQWWDRLVRAGAYAVAMAFIAGQFDVEGDLIAALRWWHAHRVVSTSDKLLDLLSRLRFESWFQTMAHARRNIRFHYDRSNAFYQQFLDQRMVYSCAYFADPTWSLDDAQLAKLDHICRKLDLHSDDRFLDVGCGWGALVIHAAERYGASSVGCTLSDQQLAFAREAVWLRGLHGRVVVDDLDYRAIPGCFDKIASVGMYEHVGRRRLDGYFRTLATHLEPDGLLLNHGIVRPQGIANDGSTTFLQRRVFPGGELPYLFEVIRAAERAGFEVLDVENLRPHYALTCATWVARLQAHRRACLEVVDAVTYRTWLLYLAAAAVSFERGETDVYQTLLASRAAGAPRQLTREYMYRRSTL